jgi:hypothetical protein
MSETILLIVLIFLSSLSCLGICFNGYRLMKYIRDREDEMKQDINKELLQQNLYDKVDDTIDI